ncbi:MAG: Transposase [Ignavibacteria bacterium]|nr:MAG: Transposase [Ignavibacteria bacterium]
MAKKRKKIMWWHKKYKRRKKKRKNYKKDEARYNLIQENEFFIFLKYLPLAALFVCKNEDLWKGEGRPPCRLRDILICLSIQQYFGKSLRRSIGIIRFVTQAANISVNIPCFKTLDNYLNNPLIKPYLTGIIEITSKPLSEIEKYFATDCTGETTSTASTWFCIRSGKTIKKKDHVTAHITTGTMLNIVTAITVNAYSGEDNIIFRKHNQFTAKNFEVKEHSGDSAYLCRENCDDVESVGGMPFFRPKSNTLVKSDGSYAWLRMMLNYYNHPIKAKRSYNRRLNVESTNHAKKAKFGSHVKSKNDTAKETESTIQWIDYNFSVLSRAYYEYDIEPYFVK